MVQDAQTLLRAGGITALHDPTEGGLATAAQELANAAGHGVILDETAIPILPETRAITDCLGLDPLGLLASGSLLAAATPEAVHDIIATALDQGIAVSDIGVVVSDDVALLRRASGDIVPLPELSKRRGRSCVVVSNISLEVYVVSGQIVASSNASVGIAAGIEVLRRGGSAADAVIAAIKLVEANPEDHSVGYSGLPNLDGDVELDASIMIGRGLRAGAVGALQGYQDAIELARHVMDDLPHAMIAGPGTARLAHEVGLPAVESAHAGGRRHLARADR